MEKELTDKLDEIIDIIKESQYYKNCLLLKTKMSSNQEITAIVEKIKVLQKKYVKTAYQDLTIKEELDCLEKRLNQIPLYLDYMNNLKQVNDMIDLLKDELNNYFYNLFNN